MTEDLNFVLRARREKLARLDELGIPAFAYSYDVTHSAASALRSLPEGAAEGPEVAVAGRIVAWRPHGKTIFGHVADATSRIQVYFRRDDLGDAAWSLLELLDMGDLVGVRGPMFRTRTGETTVKVERVSLLAKSLRPLPFGKDEIVDGAVVRHSGFSDPEQRYRQRYADLAVHADVRRRFIARSRMITEIRRCMDEWDYLEVETPVLQPLYGGAAARPFTTHHNALDMPLYLRIADELYLKRLVVGGLERVYEIGHDFRNEGIDRTHNPEFTMLEFYEAWADYTVMMGRVEQLLVRASDAVRQVLDARAVSPEERLLLPDESLVSVPEFRPPFPRIEWVPTLNQALGADIMTLDDATLRARAERIGVHKVETLSRPKVLDEMFQALVESKIDTPTFVVDYPVELSPLAKPKRGVPGLTERFELFARGKELANAFSELNDPIDQRRRFEAQARLREAGDEEATGVDEDYLRAMEYGMPPMGGVGIGMDRLFMYLSGAQNIRDVILFPTMRPE
ncbi:MAG: lysine--tRNA ligase [Gemmatimonadaceae bacterium]|nr:lysine--tRNA ligase [Gemmatimonadaceae bacterium]